MVNWSPAWNVPPIVTVHTSAVPTPAATVSTATAVWSSSPPPSSAVVSTVNCLLVVLCVIVMTLAATPNVYFVLAAGTSATNCAKCAAMPSLLAIHVSTRPAVQSSTSAPS